MTYNSAHDLPSFVELSNQIKAFKLLGFLLPKDLRTQLKELEAQIKQLGDTVDSFYALLGDRHWIFHDPLNVEKVRAILEQNTGAEDAERQFIALYNDLEFLNFAIMRCNGFEALRKRMHLMEKARDDYVAGRYYACIYLLISIADGFVNELEREHKGLHARDSEELSAWDSPISHHQGIARIHRVFTKQISATITEPVYELYRNGIMHGTVLNFDNIIVATKAWNLLFAVVDWAAAKAKGEAPKPPEKSFKETINHLIEIEKDTKLMEAWSPYVLRAGEVGFTEDPAYIACVGYLEAWKTQKYGNMSKLITHMVVSSKGNAMPKLIRDNYALFPLENFEILAVNHTTAGFCEIEVRIKTAGKDEHIATLRWRYEDNDGNATMLPKGNGEWKLVSWGVSHFVS